MNVVDRYLLAVKVFLPRKTQQDIITELSEDIRSRIVDRESSLGRPLTEAEQESMVKELGHPALLAGRYGPRRHLIGAEVFPFYWLVLKLTFAVSVALQAAAAIAMFSAGHGDRAVYQVSVVLPILSLLQFGVITIVFAVLDVYGVPSRVSLPWSPRSLPVAVERPQTVVHLIMTMIAAAWWLAVLRVPVLMFGPHVGVIRFAPIWETLYVPILLLTVANMALRVVDLVRPHWTRARSIAHVVISVLTLGILYSLMRAGEWITFVDESGQSAKALRVISVINQVFPWLFGFTVVLLVGALLLRLRGLSVGRQGVIQTL